MSSRDAFAGGVVARLRYSDPRPYGRRESLLTTGSPVRPPLDVLITVDTEVWPRSPGGTRWDGSDLRPHVRRDIYGDTADGAFGLPYQIDVLNAHGLKAVFMVEALFADAVGPGPLREIVGLVQQGGHEVQLHVHSEWLGWMPEPPLPARTGRAIAKFTEEEQVVLLAHGLENLRRAGASDVRAFRAGNYGANFDTLRALARVGIPFDTSYNLCYLRAGCGLGLAEPLVQPRMLEGVCEVPISFFGDYPGHYRHAQLTSCSFGEMRLALNRGWEGVWRTFVIVSHSFELLGRNHNNIPAAPDRIVIGRFEKLCRFLGANRDRFRTVGFSDLDPAALVAPTTATKLRTGVLSTTLRYGEQLVRRWHRLH